MLILISLYKTQVSQFPNAVEKTQESLHWALVCQGFSSPLPLRICKFPINFFPLHIFSSTQSLSMIIFASLPVCFYRKISEKFFQGSFVVLLQLLFIHGKNVLQISGWSLSVFELVAMMEKYCALGLFLEKSLSLIFAVSLQQLVQDI